MQSQAGRSKNCRLQIQMMNASLGRYHMSDDHDYEVCEAQRMAETHEFQTLAPKMLRLHGSSSLCLRKDSFSCPREHASRVEDAQYSSCLAGHILSSRNAHSGIEHISHITSKLLATWKNATRTLISISCIPTSAVVDFLYARLRWPGPSCS